MFLHRLGRRHPERGCAAYGGSDNPRFTLAVVPDTQYLFDTDRGDAAPLTACSSI